MRETAPQPMVSTISRGRVPGVYCSGLATTRLTTTDEIRPSLTDSVDVVAYGVDRGLTDVGAAGVLSLIGLFDIVGLIVAVLFTVAPFVGGTIERAVCLIPGGHDCGAAGSSTARAGAADAPAPGTSDVSEPAATPQESGDRGVELGADVGGGDPIEHDHGEVLEIGRRGSPSRLLEPPPSPALVVGLRLAS